MQAFRLVNGGFVDRILVFDSLPERLVKGIRTRKVAGLPRAWERWLASIESVHPVMKTETTLNPDRSYSFKYTPIGNEPCFFVLEYTDINADKEAWRAICEYLRLNVGPEVRLKEKIEEMALPMAGDPKSPLGIEPEDVPVITVQAEAAHEGSDEEPGPALKKPGRPRKVVAVGV